MAQSGRNNQNPGSCFNGSDDTEDISDVKSNMWTHVKQLGEAPKTTASKDAPDVWETTGGNLKAEKKDAWDRWQVRACIKTVELLSGLDLKDRFNAQAKSYVHLTVLKVFEATVDLTTDTSGDMQSTNNMPSTFSRSRSEDMPAIRRPPAQAVFENKPFMFQEIGVGLGQEDFLRERPAGKAEPVAGPHALTQDHKRARMGDQWSLLGTRSSDQGSSPPGRQRERGS
ncbi:hypothetical protein MBLNU230_g2298t1 [Neophaeotheca triangularis]